MLSPRCPDLDRKDWSEVDSRGSRGDCPAGQIYFLRQTVLPALREDVGGCGQCGSGVLLSAAG